MFYGSQTGTAEEFANRLSKDAQRYGMKGMAADPEEYDMVMAQYFDLASVMSIWMPMWLMFKRQFQIFHLMQYSCKLFSPFFLQNELSRLKEIDNSLAIFCMATYGEGDPTDNSQDFYDLLQEGDLDLDGVKFTASEIWFLFFFFSHFLWDLLFS